MVKKLMIKEADIIVIIVMVMIMVLMLKIMAIVLKVELRTPSMGHGNR